MTGKKFGSINSYENPILQNHTYLRTMPEWAVLQRRLFEAGGGAGMTSENFMSFVEANPAIAYREMLRREAMMQENEALV